MFLLIRRRENGYKHERITFTFHNVSINSLRLRTIWSPKLYLHSTMFLLIRINSSLLLVVLLDLHSTMFLLIPVNTALSKFKFFHLHSTMFLLIRLLPVSDFDTDYTFTFHNVSINSTLIRCIELCNFVFTFHNVSINSLFFVMFLCIFLIIYIPQCFY